MGLGRARYAAQHARHHPVVREEEVEEGNRCTLGCLRSKDILWHTISPLLSGFTPLLPQQCVCDLPPMRLTSHVVTGTDVRTVPRVPLRLPYSLPLSATQRPTPHTPKPSRTRMGVHACALSFLLDCGAACGVHETDGENKETRGRDDNAVHLCVVRLCSRVHGNLISAGRHTESRMQDLTCVCVRVRGEREGGTQTTSFTRRWRDVRSHPTRIPFLFFSAFATT